MLLTSDCCSKTIASNYVASSFSFFITENNESDKTEVERKLNSRKRNAEWPCICV